MRTFNFSGEAVRNSSCRACFSVSLTVGSAFSLASALLCFSVSVPSSLRWLVPLGMPGIVAQKGSTSQGEKQTRRCGSGCVCGCARV
jgi:hypothetical protein